MANDTNNGARLERAISLPGAVALVVGGVVGSGIFALVREMTEQAGNAIWLAFLLAMTVSLVGVIPLIQIAVVLPRAGGGYLYTSRMISPLAGLITSCCVLLGGAGSTIVVTLTLAAYVSGYFNLDLPQNLVGLGILAMFYGIYWGGLRLAMGLQVIMAAQFLIALVIYAVAGMLATDLEISMTSPKGGQGMFMAFLLCYLTCLGFQVLAEMGEEIKHARRNIPLALMIGAVIVAAIYIAVGVVFASSVPREALGELRAPLADSARAFLPPAAVNFLFLGALTAGLTSLNAAAIALPRELFAQARDGIAPRIFARVERHTHVPMHAVTAYVALVAGLLLLGRELDYYGYLAAVGIQAMSAVVCVASLRLEKRFPERFKAAYLHVPRAVLWTCTALTVLASTVTATLLAVERPSIVASYLCLIAAVAIYYRFRVAALLRSGFPFHEVIRELPGEDEAEEAQGSA